MITSRAARFVRAARIKAGLTQRGLARKSRIPQPTIAAIETGRQDPRHATLERLLRACGFQLEIFPKLGEGVDRTLIREMFDLTPAERARRAIETARALGRLDQVLGRH